MQTEYKNKMVDKSSNKKIAKKVKPDVSKKKKRKVSSSLLAVWKRRYGDLLDN